MLDFVHRNLDNSREKPAAVVCCLVDFSKAFNRIDHNVIVTILSDLNVPTCALRLVVSYLSNRKMCVRWNGATSNEQDIPGGGPQGGLLTVLLFNLQVNLAGAPCPLKATLPSGTFGPEPAVQLPEQGPLQPVPAVQELVHPATPPLHHEHEHSPTQHLPPCHKKEKILKKKYVDYLSLLEAINLKTSLKPMAPLIGPKNLHDLPGLYFPLDQSVLQHQLSDLASFTIKNKMKINHKKTKIIPFNFSKSYDFTPQLHFPNSEVLEVINESL